MGNTITMVPDAIHRPDEPRHFMVIEPRDGDISAFVDGQRIALSPASYIAREVGGHIYDPVTYFPRDAVQQGVLVKTAKTTFCPLKGTASYFDVVSKGKTYTNAAWSYEEVLTFDSRLKAIEGAIGFDQNQPCVKVD